MLASRVPRFHRVLRRRTQVQEARTAVARGLTVSSVTLALFKFPPFPPRETRRRGWRGWRAGNTSIGFGLDSIGYEFEGPLTASKLGLEKRRLSNGGALFKKRKRLSYFARAARASLVRVLLGC